MGMVGGMLPIGVKHIHQANVASQESVNKLLEKAKDSVQEEIANHRSEMHDQMQTENSVFDSKEAGSVNKKQLGKKDDTDTTHQNLTQKDTAQKARGIQEMSQAHLGLGLAQEVEKKRRKKSKMEETIEALASLEGSMDLDALSESEKKELEEFFSNVSRMKKMKAKLQYLEDQEELMEEALRKEDERKRRQQEKELSQNPEDEKEGASHG